MRCLPLLLLLFFSVPARAGELDHFQRVFRFVLNMEGRRYRTKLSPDRRVFTVLMTGRPHLNIMLDPLPKWAGTVKMWGEVGPLTRIEIAFPHQWFMVKQAQTGGVLNLVVGELRPEYRLQILAQRALNQGFPVPEGALLEPYPETEQLIKAGQYEEAYDTLKKLHIGHGNGLRGLRMGDMEISAKRLATAHRSYDGVVRRFGNMFFSTMARIRLIALEGVLNGKPYTYRSLIASIGTLKPARLRDEALLEAARVFYFLNKERDALRALIPLDLPQALELKREIVAGALRSSYGSGDYARTIVLFDHYRGLLERLKGGRELLFKAALFLLHYGLGKRAVPIIQKELKLHGKWRKSQVFPERAYAALGRAYAQAGNWFRAESTVRYYLENRPPGAPNESQMWGLFSTCLLKNGRRRAALVVRLKSLETDWNPIRAAQTALKLARAAQKEGRHEEAVALAKTLFKRVERGGLLEQGLFLMTTSLEKLGRLDEVVPHYRRVQEASPRLHFTLSRVLRRLGDTIGERLELEQGVLLEGRWSQLARQRLRYLERAKEVAGQLQRNRGKMKRK